MSIDGASIAQSDSQYSSITSLTNAKSQQSRLSNYALLKRYFEDPRNNCIEIAPYLQRLQEEENIQTQKEWEHRIRKLLVTYRVENVEKHIQCMLVTNVDASDTVMSHGEVSKRMYKQFCDTFRFNLYGQQIMQKTNVVTKSERRILNILAGDASLNSISQGESGSVHNMIASQESIGYKDRINAPVGLYQTKQLVSKSLQNEAQYSYRGEWVDGRLAGRGEYFYKDGETYKGEFSSNAPNGQGTATYACGASYTGAWKDSLFEGAGRLSCCEGDIVYTGGFSIGRREGSGELVLPCGLTYTGEYLNGRAHGRGVMASALTGFSYDGSFDRGSIAGSGTLVCPDGRRLVLHTEGREGEALTLPALVRNHLNGIAQSKLERTNRMETLTQVKRGLALGEYLEGVRRGLSDMRNQAYVDDLRERKRIHKKNRREVVKSQRQAFGELHSKDEDEEKESGSSGSEDEPSVA